MYLNLIFFFYELIVNFNLRAKRVIIEFPHMLRSLCGCYNRIHSHWILLKDSKEKHPLLRHLLFYMETFLKKLFELKLDYFNTIQKGHLESPISVGENYFNRCRMLTEHEYTVLVHKTVYISSTVNRLHSNKKSVSYLDALSYEDFNTIIAFLTPIAQPMQQRILHNQTHVVSPDGDLSNFCSFLAHIVWPRFGHRFTDQLAHKLSNDQLLWMDRMNYNIEVPKLITLQALSRFAGKCRIL